MAALPKTHILPVEYLALDRQAETRSEYIDGEMIAMSGASMRHNMITSNIPAGSLLGLQLYSQHHIGKLED